ncbi:hypothetical protein H6P81_004328 [Aristolochia fimbriata]|uniref:E3 ubiquitin-protein ligase RMA n=1 Tax=Aristolochia fimbriata TaxID=158543 RepID=A0AAV7FHF2_ARIFI|nr:hypothetical protein H6P81_004328 [Aristolochia fimbriata]
MGSRRAEHRRSNYNNGLPDLASSSTTRSRVTTQEPSPVENPSSAAGVATQIEEEEKNEVEENVGGGGASSGFFGCNICFEMAVDPVLTPCGHLFCWPCIYRWLNGGGYHPRKCPVCMGDVISDNVTPIYGRGPDNPRTPAAAADNTDPVRGMPIPPRPSAHRVVTGRTGTTTSERRPRRSSISRHRSSGGGGSGGAGHEVAVAAEAGFRPSPMVDFVGVTTGPLPAYAGIPLEGQAYFQQPLEAGIYFAPITSIHPHHYLSFAPGTTGIPSASTDRNILRHLPPLPSHPQLMQCLLEDARHLYNVGPMARDTPPQQPLLVLGMDDGIHDGLTEMLNILMDEDPLLPPRRAGAPEERGAAAAASRVLTSGHIFQPIPPPEFGFFASSTSSTTATTRRGNTSAAPPRSLGEPTFPPPEKRRRL